MAKALAVHEALLIERSVSMRVLEEIARIAQEPVEGSTTGPERIAFLTQLCDFIAFAPMQILLGFAERLSEIAPASLVKVENWQRWYLRRRFYGESLPRPVLLELEEIVSRLRFEKSIEGRVLTADWYLRERYAAILAGRTTGMLEPILSRIEEAYVPVVTRLVATSSKVPAMHVALRGLEVCHKFAYHLRIIAEWCASMRSLHIRNDDAVTPPDVAGFTKRVAAIEASLYETIPNLTFEVYDAGATRERGMPDYFGQAYIIVAAKTFERMRDGAPNAANLFRSFFGLSLLAVRRLGRELEDAEPVLRFTYVTEPYIHLLELSGYAYLFSQLGGKGNVWHTVREMWEGALGKYFDPKIIRAVFEERVMMMRPWYTLRFNWQRAFRDEIVAASYAGRWFSPLLGVVRDYLSSSFDGILDLDARDVFFLVFLRYQAGFEDAKLPRGAESLQRRADRMDNEAE
jgi:DNA-binding Lrp family transcriptional regulator